ncbi:hypothetical protein [Paraburkholderia sp. BR14312]|uniref:hypothetical protein n=1 Tax=unclassified Paraburkholderia TaxID=2615204 RepID=UPI0034CD452C
MSYLPYKEKRDVPLGLATLTAVQMRRIRKHGISIELHPGREAKGVETYMRATLHCNGPAATRAVLNELFRPGAICLPGWMEGIGGRAPQHLLIVGLFHLKHGDYVVRAICPPDAWYT